MCDTPCFFTIFLLLKLLVVAIRTEIIEKFKDRLVAAKECEREEKKFKKEM